MTSLFDLDLSDYDLSQEEFLRAIHEFVRSRIPEGPLVEYKRDLSDSWLEAAAAFANSSGGLILLGVNEEGGVPTEVVGVSTQSGDLKTKLTNQILSRIEPRVDFSIGVARLAGGEGREVAAVRVRECSSPPYVYSKQDHKRVLVRVGDRKVDADYQSLTRLFEKREALKLADERTARAFDRWRNFVPRAPRERTPHTETAQAPPSKTFCRFVCVPAASDAARPLDLETERILGRCFAEVFSEDVQRAARPLTRGSEAVWERDIWSTSVGYFGQSDGDTPHFERRWALGGDGSIAFASECCPDPAEHARNSPFVLPNFVYDLVRFVCMTRAYYRRISYFGPCRIQVEIRPPANVFVEFSGTFHNLPFPLDRGCLSLPQGGVLSVRGNAITTLHLGPSPAPDATGLSAFATEAPTSLIRFFGGAVHRQILLQGIRPLVEEAVSRVRESQRRVDTGTEAPSNSLN